MQDWLQGLIINYTEAESCSPLQWASGRRASTSLPLVPDQNSSGLAPSAPGQSHYKGCAQHELRNLNFDRVMLILRFEKFLKYSGAPLVVELHRTRFFKIIFVPHCMQCVTDIILKNSGAWWGKLRLLFSHTGTRAVRENKYPKKSKDLWARMQILKEI